MDDLTDLSLVELYVLHTVQHLEDDTGWCRVGRKALAEHHEVSILMYDNLTSKLIADGYLATRSNKHLKTTNKCKNLGISL